MTKRVQKYIVLAAFTFLRCSALLTAVDFGFTIQPFYRASWGMLHEYVRTDNNGDGTLDYNISRLDWDISGISAIGASCSFIAATTRNHQLKLNASYAWEIPENSGYMQDYDWQHIENNVYCGQLTNYSIHDNTLEKGYSFSVGGAWTLPVGLGFDIGWDIRQLSFSGSNGYRQYDSSIKHIDLATEPKIPFTGTVITYNYQCNYLRLGITYTYEKLHRPGIYLGVWFIPAEAATGHDIHCLRDTSFLDVMYGYMCGFQEKAAVTFPLSQHFRLYLREEGSLSTVIEGPTYSWSGNTMPARPIKIGYGGSSLEEFSLSAGISLIF